VGPSRDDGHADPPVSVGQVVGVSSEAGKERQGNQVRVCIDRRNSNLLMYYLDGMLGRGERGEMNAGDRRHEIKKVSAPIARRVADNYANLHARARMPIQKL